MSIRTGDNDPGLVYYLERAERMSTAPFHGMRGISVTSSDLRDLLARKACDYPAAEAVAYQATKWIGSYAAALGGVDSLVFADRSRNARNGPLISSNTGRVKVRVHT